MARSDPYLRASFSLQNRGLRAVWGLTYLLLFFPSPRPFHTWRAFLLRLFGARLGPKCRIYPRATIWAPWNLVCADAVVVANGAIIYNPAIVEIGSHAVISQQAYVCGATHDLDTPGFRLISDRIKIGRYAWLCARSTLQMGIIVGDGAVLGLGAVATRNLDPWTIYAGIPAKAIRSRKQFDAQA